MAEYMTDDDRVAAIRKWWDENGTLAVVGLVLVIAGVVGWRWYVDYQKSRHETASAVYQQYTDLREAGGKDTEGMAKALETLDRDFKGSSYQVFTLFFRAADAIQREDFAEGEKRLREAVDVASNGYLEDLARVRLARVLHQENKDDQALDVLQRVKGAGFRSYAAEFKGDILLAAGKSDDALAAYRVAADVEGADRERPLLKMKIADLTTAGTGAKEEKEAKKDAPAS